MDAIKKSHLGGFLFLLALLVISCQQKEPRVAPPTLNGQSCESSALPTSFLVSWKHGVPKAYAHLQIDKHSSITRFKGLSRDEIEQNVLKNFSPGDLYAEHEFRVYTEETLQKPTGPLTVPQAWGVSLIRVADAWYQLNRKGAGITVAVLDSGFDINHSLLKPQFWQNPGETGLDSRGRNKATNNVDDDGNGYVDDVVGWNFFDNNKDLTDGIAHGTHVSGIVLGLPGRYGFVGVAPEAKLMALKFMDQNGGGNIGDAITAIDYAVTKGARVINASWGGGYCSQLLKEKISWATGHNSSFMVAAGNSSRDINKIPQWPAAFVILGKLTIGAIGIDSMLSSYSNFGVLVDVAAPGDDIISTIPTEAGTGVLDPLGTMSGTSMATPFVSGLAALLLSARPSMTPTETIDMILGGIKVEENIGVRTRGRIDAFNSANYLLSH